MAKIRTTLEWSQARMAKFLGCDQATISRVENGQPEPGPIARLLDLVESGAIDPRDHLPAPLSESERAA